MPHSTMEKPWTYVRKKPEVEGKLRFVNTDEYCWYVEHVLERKMKE